MEEWSTRFWRESKPPVQQSDVSMKVRSLHFSTTVSLLLVSSLVIPACGIQENAKVVSLIASMQAKGHGVSVRFVDEAGTLTAEFNVGDEDQQAKHSLGSTSIAAGEGVPLFPVKESLLGKSESLPELNVSLTVERDGWKLNTVVWKSRPSDTERVNVKKYLWSPDGKQLFALSEYGLVYRIESDKWQVTHHSTAKGKDIAWSAAGLVLIEPGSQKPQKPWIQLEPMGPNASNNQRLRILDPATLEVKQAWRVEGDWVAGRPDSSVVYVVSTRTTSNRWMQVIDVRRGLLLNAFDRFQPLPERETDLSGKDHSFSHETPATPGIPTLSADGRHLFTVWELSGDSSRLLRLRVEGVRLICEERVRNFPVPPLTILKLSSGQRYLCVPDTKKSGFSLLDSNEFSKLAGTLDGPPKSAPARVQMAFDETSRTGFLVIQPDAISDAAQLIVRQKNVRIEFPLGEIYVIDLHPQGRGAMLSGPGQYYWLESGPAGPPLAIGGIGQTW